MATFVSPLPEMHLLDRSPLEQMRRTELFKMAVEDGKLSEKSNMPTKDELIVIITNSQPERKKPEVNMSQYSAMKHFELQKVCREEGISHEKTDRREVLIHKIRAHFEVA